MNQPHAGLYKAYHRASHTVGKTRQVVMLYDGMIRFLQQAAEAIEKKDYEARYHKLARVSDIIIGLQSCLDFEAGGPSAKGLYDFYAALDARIFALHRSNDLKACRAIIAEIKDMRDAWDGIDRGGEMKAQGEAAKPAAGLPDSTTVSA
ncbi:MAG: flagellar export chaperone FliS [Alphaproteobacteria bacterium]|nr:flagellar export chaperone FliS [Alphaproteobacteria bacterium]